jgi:hypothetical protein
MPCDLGDRRRRRTAAAGVDAVARRQVITDCGLKTGTSLRRGPKIPTSPILIFGLGPVPRLGIGDAGIAFGIYYVAAMLFLLRYMASGRAGLTFRVVPLRVNLFTDILKVGVPTAVNALLTNLTVILVTGSVGLFGTTALAAYGIASRLDYVMIPILFGLCTATLTGCSLLTIVQRTDNFLFLFTFFELGAWS